MNKKSPYAITQYFSKKTSELGDFFGFFFYYFKRKVVAFSVGFEKNKNRLVKFFIMKRGRYNRPFLHLATMGVLGIGVVIAPFLADSFPMLSSKSSPLVLAASDSQKQSVLVGQDVFETQVSAKPRSSIITYTVQKGDTIETIASKYGISADTIRWANDLSSDDLSIGQEVKILPVSGVAHKVQPGDTVYSIAKQYHVDPQPIVDFPFNEFANPETFALVSGQILIVPGGTITASPDQSSVSSPTPQTYVDSGPIPVSHGGWVWPVPGIITQYPAWYHMAVDIAGPIGTTVVAAHAGTVSRVSQGTYDTGYGDNVWVDDGDGIRTHYAHLSCIVVHVGESVSAGQQVGCRGNSGRSTGPHTHFEVQVNGTLVNPLGYVNP
jgi:murein DD-endopeptidase MepM/ murein hydrolase activator NlpD